MKRLTSHRLGAFLAPAIALCVGSVLAQEPRANPESTETRQSAAVPATPARNATPAIPITRAARSELILTMPIDAFLAEESVGSPVMSRQNQNFGPIRDFIVDDGGQIVAAIVEVGDYLGVGDRDVAIAWASLERTMGNDGEGVFHVNMTDAALRAAPEYTSD